MNRLNLILLLGILVLCGLLFKSCDDHKQTQALLFSVQDSLTKAVDKNGVQTATIAVMEGSIDDLTKNIKSKDSTILRLQATAKKYKRDLQAATSIDITTKETVKEKTTIIKSDTVTIDNTHYVYPVYEAMIKKRYSSYYVSASKDSIEVIAAIKNKLDVNWVYEREKRFAPKRLVAKIVTYNQNTEVEEMHSFKPTEKKGKKAWRIAEKILCLASGMALQKAINKP